MTDIIPSAVDVNWPEVLTGEMLFVGLLGKLWYQYPDRAWYQALIDNNAFAEAPFGLEAANDGREPEDHIGLELALLAHLSSLGVAALEAGEVAKLAETLAAQRGFLDTHLLQWASAWCQQVEAKAETVFYKSAARLTRGALAAQLPRPTETAAA